MLLIWVLPKLLSLEHEVLLLNKSDCLRVFFLTSSFSSGLRSLLVKLSFGGFWEKLGLIVAMASHCHCLDVAIGALGLETHFLVVIRYFVEAFLLKEA